MAGSGITEFGGENEQLCSRFHAKQQIKRGNICVSLVIICLESRNPRCYNAGVCKDNAAGHPAAPQYIFYNKEGVI